MKKMYTPENIRNVAIIAHIDHGKTTLLDALLKQSNVFAQHETTEERMMDSNELERERGITIFAKHTSLFFEDLKINLIDTPGHADFSGEVERVLGMVNSVILLIDAGEGPKPQTRFVLSAALKMGIKPIVVLNKIDKPHADPDQALNKTFDLFVELGASDEQLDFKYCYASGINGFATAGVDDPRKDMRPLFELIAREVPPPPGNLDLSFLMQVMTLSYDDFLGRGATGRILEGKIKKGQNITAVNKDGHPTTHKITRIDGYLGLNKVEMEEAGVGDIVSISGIPDIMIGDTLCEAGEVKQLPSIDLSEPTVSIDFMVNNSPFVGKDGKHVTMNKIRDRLQKEKRSNISFKIEDVPGKDDAIRVYGKGELHLAVLIEAMRRESYEFTISKPQVVVKVIEGAKQEPYDIAHIEVKEEHSGTIIDTLSRRKGEMRSLMTNEQGITSLEFFIPTRGLMGYRNEFLTSTRGEGILTATFEEYGSWKGDISNRITGSLVASHQGRATGYALFNLQGRGTLFVKPGDEVYEGMVVGEHSRENDLTINVTKEKQLTNVRSTGTDENVILTPARVFTLEQAIDFIANDEWIEITPNHIRLRKQLLKENERKTSRR